MFDKFFDLFKKNTDQDNLADTTSLGANVNNLSLHSDAGREFVKAYSGYDGATGQNLTKSLSKISNYKPNIAHKGYTAEVIDVARRNKENILNGDSIRYSRVDDLPGHKVNETPYDIMAIDKNGNEIVSLGAQVKFLSKNPHAFAKFLTSLETENKYPHARFTVPAEKYVEVKQEIADIKISLKNQIESAKQRGDLETLTKTKNTLDYVKKVDKNLIKSKLSTSEAEYAVTNPVEFTTQEIIQLGHETGVKYAQSAALISGSLAFANCVDKLIKGEITPEEAAIKVTTESGKAALIGYATGHANTALASVMKNSSKELLRNLGNSSAPAQIIVFTTSAFRIINDRMEGKISDEECFHSLAKSGLGVAGTFEAAKLAGNMITSSGIIASGSIVATGGTILASLVAGIIINSTYDYAVKTLKAPGIAKEERIKIEQQCLEIRKQLEEYRNNFRNTYVSHTHELEEIFGNSLHDMALALQMDDADSFISSANSVTRALGGKPQFNNVDEFEQLDVLEL